MKLELTNLQQLNLEDLLKGFSGLQGWNDLLTVSELTDKIALPEDVKSAIFVRALPDGRALMDLTKAVGNVEIDLHPAEKRMLLRVLNESNSKFTCVDVAWLRPLRKQLEQD